MQRAQVYTWDMGLFRKSYIMFADVEKVNEMNFTKYQLAFILPESDPYGHTLPESFDGYIRE